MYGQSVSIVDTIIDIESKKTSIKELISFNIIDIYEDEDGDPNVKIKTTSLSGKTIRSLEFKIFIISRKGKEELDLTWLTISEPISDSYISNHRFSSYSDFYKLLKGASKDDYLYRFQITSMIYDGELIVK